MKRILSKENITQIFLIIVSILIAFALDRVYENYKTGQDRKEFVKMQIKLLESENERIGEVNEFVAELIKRADRGLEIDAPLDTIISYTQWLPNFNNFNPEFSNLRELREVYPIDKYLSTEMKREFHSLYSSYESLRFYENEYKKDINNRFRPFWQQNFNAFDKTFKNKENFRSAEYLNIISNCREVLSRRIANYDWTREKHTALIEKLKEL